MSNEQLIADLLTGIGGSESGSAIGISRYRTPYTLWLQKIGELPPTPPNEEMYWGTVLQPLVAAEYCRRTGRTIEEPGLMRHPVHHWLIGHVDGKVIGMPRILEVKCTRRSTDWGDPGTDQIPLEHVAQCHHYLALTDAEAVDVAVLIGGNDFRLYEVVRDREFARELIAKEHEFWWHVENRVPPQPIEVKDAVRRWGRFSNSGDIVVASEEDLKAIATLRQCRTDRQTLEEREEAAKLAVMQRLSDLGDTLVDLDNKPLATWRLDKGRKEYTAHYKARDPERQFRLI